MEKLYRIFQNCSGVSTDSRTIFENCLFVALKGPSFNGNIFIKAALKSGASYALADERLPEFESDDRIIIVEDCLSTLQALALFHRSKLKIPIIALTGSNGKTTTKELIKAALSTTYKCYATKGNLNNHIGVPLSLLEINGSHEIAIIEMGANHQKEIEMLCEIARPDYGCITNIGLAHLEGFGGAEGIYKGKKELFDFIRENEGKIFLNMDDPKVVRAGEAIPAIRYGTDSKSHYQGRIVSSAVKMSIEWWRDTDQTRRSLSVQLTGSYNFSNVLSAIAIARFFGVTDANIKKGIESYRPSNNRSQIENTSKSNTVIVDCYNANPSSVIAAIENLNSFNNDNSIAILGDMLEVGDESDQYHEEVLQKLKESNKKGILIGPNYLKFSTNYPDFEFYTSTQEFSDALANRSITDSIVLLKGSRKMKLEQLLELL